MLLQLNSLSTSTDLKVIQKKDKIFIRDRDQTKRHGMMDANNETNTFIVTIYIYNSG